MSLDFGKKIIGVEIKVSNGIGCSYVKDKLPHGSCFGEAFAIILERLVGRALSCGILEGVGQHMREYSFLVARHAS